MMGLLCCLCSAVTGQARAQTSLTGHSTKLVVGHFAPVLDESDAQRAYQIVESWVKTPKPPNELEITQPILVTDAAGVFVVLRRDGWSMGTGQTWVTDENNEQVDPSGHLTDSTPLSDQKTKMPAVDLAQLAHRATQRALAQARESFMIAQERALVTDIPTSDHTEDPSRPKLRSVQPPSWQEVRAMLQIDLQIARTPQPIRITGDPNGLDRSQKPSLTGTPGKYADFRIHWPMTAGFHGLRLAYKQPAGTSQAQVSSWPGARADGQPVAR